MARERQSEDLQGSKTISLGKKNNLQVLRLARSKCVMNCEPKFETNPRLNNAKVQAQRSFYVHIVGVLAMDRVKEFFYFFQFKHVWPCDTHKKRVTVIKANNDHCVCQRYPWRHEYMPPSIAYNHECTYNYDDLQITITNQRHNRKSTKREQQRIGLSSTRPS